MKQESQQPHVAQGTHYSGYSYLSHHTDVDTPKVQYFLMTKKKDNQGRASESLEAKKYKLIQIF